MEKVRSSLAFKLLSNVLGICIVGMMLISTTGILIFRSSFTGESLSKIAQTTSKEAERINGWLEKQEAYVSALSGEFSYLTDFSKASMLPRLNTHVDANGQYFDVYMGYPDGKVTFASGVDPDYAAGWASYKRPWYVGAMESPGTPFITSPYTDVQTGGLCITASITVERNGNILGVVGIDILIDQLDKIVEDTDIGEGSYAFLVSSAGDILIHPDKSLGPDENDIFQKFTEIDNMEYAGVWEDIIHSSNSVRANDASGTAHYFTAAPIPASGWYLVTAIPTGVVKGPVYELIIISAIIAVSIEVLAFILISLLLKKTIINPVKMLTNSAKLLEQGNLDIQSNLTTSRSKDEIGVLSGTIDRMADQLKVYIQDISKFLSAMSNNNFTTTSAVTYNGDFEIIGNSLAEITMSLNNTLDKISMATEQVGGGASQMASGAQSLASGSTEQAASVEELSATVLEVSHQAEANAEQMQKVTHLLSKAGNNLNEGSNHMTQLITAMSDISSSSHQIANITKIIEDKAFQTNILALNAAVEAARAGEAGKGFAVVADEVRNLAAKSADAAQQTGNLISTSVQAVDRGSAMTSETADILLEAIKEINRVIGDINDAERTSTQQAMAIDQIQEGLSLVSSIVQTNAATAQENAAISEEMSSQSDLLRREVSKFKLLRF